MWTKGIFFLMGVFLTYEVLSQATDTYISELMVESNVTLDAQTVLSSWNTPDNLVVTVNGISQTVVFQSRELVGECLVVGDDYNCSCSANYHWSNEVCYSYQCCTDTPCEKNVSFVTPMCIPKINVTINGTIYTANAWSTTNNPKVTTALDVLNALLVPTAITTYSSVAPFTAQFAVTVGVAINSSKLQEILDNMKTTVAANAIYVDTQGLVILIGPNETTPVAYESPQRFVCKFEDPTDFAGWNLSKTFERFELNNGLQIELNPNCADNDYKSCIGVTLRKVIGAWAGVYECGFVAGTIRHTARSNLTVALLPDDIKVIPDSLTVECGSGPDPVVRVSVQIPPTTEIYSYWWSHNASFAKNTASNQGEYIDNVKINCSANKQPFKITVNFKNKAGQIKNASFDIPVIYEKDNFCPYDILGGQVWPKTPLLSTVFNQTCPYGRVGYKSRTCGGNGQWGDVFPNCVSEELKKVSTASNYFLDGLGATTSVAKDIFEGITNNSLTNSGSQGTIADIGASIDIVGTMAQASKNISLTEDVFPKFVDAASNMLTSNWTGVNDSVRFTMSSNYLSSVESLVKNININTSSGFNSSNLDLRFCSGASCNVSAFNIGVNLNMSSGTMKVMGVKNLMSKLKNNYKHPSDASSLLLSATLANSSDSKIGITLSFPKDDQITRQRYCVFWDTSLGDWSDDGCFLNTTDPNNTVCECNHLTSFSVLMAKTDISTNELDVITKIGLIVSISSLVIFLFVEFLVWPAVIKTNLSHFRHTAVVNIAVFRMLADCSFLASDTPATLSDYSCLTFTLCKHLFYLAMFFWMLCLSAMLVHQLIFVFSHLRKRVFMFLSSIVGYICPMAIVASSYVYFKYVKKDYFNRNTCWLTYESLLVGSIHAFVLPAGTIVLINLFSMVVVIVTLVKTSVPDSSKADEKEAAKSILKVVVLLTPVFGVTWAIGYFLLLLDSKNPMFMVANYSFTILNSFQGLFILITGCLAEQKVREELVKVIKAKLGMKDEAPTKSVSTGYTKDK